MRRWKGMRGRIALLWLQVCFQALTLALVAPALVLPGVARAEPAAADAEPAVVATTKPLLWKIQIAQQPASYLYGTIHVPDPRVLALPTAVEKAIASCGVVYTEIPLDAASQARAVSAASLPQGQTLEKSLPPALYERTQRYLEKRGIGIALFDRLKVWAVAAALPILDYVGMGEPLDQELYSKAQRDGKRVAALETLEMQVSALESGGEEGQQALLRDTLRYLEEAAEDGRDPTRELIDLYLEGDEDSIAREAYSYVDRDDPALKRLLVALIDRRNEFMARAIAERVRAEPRVGHFFAVGAMHYPGSQGILALLRRQGLRIERVR